MLLYPRYTTTTVKLLFLILIASQFYHCEDILTDPGKDPVDPEPINNPVPNGWLNHLIPVTLEFIDAATDQKITDVIRVKFIGAGEKVMLPDRTTVKSGKIDKGLLPLYVNAEELKLSGKNPYAFKVEAESDGYLSNFQTVVLDTIQPVSKMIYLVPKSSDIKTDRFGSQNYTNTFSGDLLKDPILYTTRFTHGEERFNSIDISLPAGIGFLDENGRRINTLDQEFNIETNLTLFSSSQPSSTRLFPGGCYVTDLIDETGKPLADINNPVFFRSLFGFSLKMNLVQGPNDRKISGFFVPSGVTPPIATIILDPRMINPQTGEEIQAGDRFKIWKLIDDPDRGATYQQEPEEAEIVAAESDPGVLTITVPGIYRPTRWEIGSVDASSCSPISVRVRSQFPVTKPYECELINPILTCDPATGRAVCEGYPYYADLVHFPPGPGVHTIRLVHTPENMDMAFSIFDEVAGARQAVASGIEVFQTCSDPQELNLLPDSELTCLKMQVNLNFTSPDTTIKVCDNALWFRDLGGPPDASWNFAGFFVNEEMQSLEIIPRISTVTGSTPGKELMIWYNTTQALEFNLPAIVMFDSVTEHSEGNNDYRKIIGANGCTTIIVDINAANVSVPREVVHRCYN
ncbi:MAG: hypothetical protein R2824_01810 [Saprospiraceae bacterium]